MKCNIAYLVALVLSFIMTAVVAAPVNTPVQLEDRDVFVPPVVLPNAESVWKIGTKQIVQWDISHRPDQITNKRGMIVLVKNGRLDIEHPLDSGFDILEGQRTVTVPNVDVSHGNKYQILVFGDSGNTGPVFTIVA